MIDTTPSTQILLYQTEDRRTRIDVRQLLQIMQ